MGGVVPKWAWRLLQDRMQPRAESRGIPLPHYPAEKMGLGVYGGNLAQHGFLAKKASVA